MLSVVRICVGIERLIIDGDHHFGGSPEADLEIIEIGALDFYRAIG